MFALSWRTDAAALLAFEFFSRAYCSHVDARLLPLELRARMRQRTGPLKHAMGKRHAVITPKIGRRKHLLDLIGEVKARLDAKAVAARCLSIDSSMVTFMGCVP